MGKPVKDMTPEEREANRARSAAWFAANRERVKVRSAAVYAANREKVLAQGAAYRAANREKVRTKDANYRAANREKIRTKYVAFRDASPERYIAYDLKRHDGITDPPQELVELIAANRRLKRLLKEKQDEQ